MNTAQKSWRAKVYPEYVGKTMHELQLRSGYKPTRNAFNGLRPQQDSLIQIDTSDIPKNFDWRSKDGQNYMDEVVDQGACGSCYAVAATSMINSRVRILTKNRVKPQLGWQQVLQCNRYSQGCAGGFPFLVEKYAQEFGLTKDDSCAKSAQKLRSLKELGDAASAEDGKTEAGNAYVRVKEYGYVGGYYGDTTTAQVMREVFDNGPVTVGLSGGYELLHYDTGIFLQTGEESVKNDFEAVDHAVVLVGWGEKEDGSDPHWILKNSAGKNWGENGYFRMHRNGDANGILSLVSQAKPVLGGSNYFNQKKGQPSASDVMNFLDLKASKTDSATAGSTSDPNEVDPAISSAWKELQESLFKSDQLLSDHEDYDYDFT